MTFYIYMNINMIDKEKEVLVELSIALDKAREIDNLLLEYGYQWGDHYFEDISDEGWLAL